MDFIYSSKANDIATEARAKLMDIIDEMVFKNEDCYIELDEPIIIGLEEDCPFDYSFSSLSRHNGVIDLFDDINRGHIGLDSLTFNELYSFIHAFNITYHNAYKKIKLAVNSN